MNESIVMIERVASALGRLCEDVVFLGGAVIRLLVTDPTVNEFRLTDDVDLIVKLTGLPALESMNAHLREKGFRNAVRPGAPICRWEYGEIIVDLMPTDHQLLGFSNRWYPTAVRTARERVLPSGTIIRLIDPVVFIATKLEAFSNRGNADCIGSKDIEDVIAVVDGRVELLDELIGAGPDIAAYVCQAIASLIRESSFRTAVLGYLPRDRIGQQRFTTIMDRFRSITELCEAV